MTSPFLPPDGRLSRAAFLRLLAGGAAALVGGGARAEGAAGPAAREAAGATAPMMTRPIPSSGEALPVVGLGTSRVFEVGKSAQARAPLLEVLETLFAAGGKVIDTSPMYGTAEIVVGDLLRDLGARDRAFLATKVWTRGRAQGMAQMRHSMSKFRSTLIDLMQVHNLLDWQAQLFTLRAWKEGGWFRYIGITHWTRESLPELARVIGLEALDFVQLPYSLAEPEAEDRLLPLAADRGVAVLVNRPYARGALFRAVRGRELPAWAGEFDCQSWGQFFLKFVLSHPAVTCAIPATRNPDHMADNVGAGRGRLPDAAQRARMLEFWRDL
jgi:aryl-alcohol dehydrogenase-like predicted oxidoreductase